FRRPRPRPDAAGPRRSRAATDLARSLRADRGRRRVDAVRGGPRSRPLHGRPGDRTCRRSRDPHDDRPPVRGGGRAMTARRLSAPGALIALGLSASPALAGVPDPGHADLFHHDPGDARLVLDWHFSSATYPDWFRSAIDAELDGFWADPVANNSNV